MIVRIALITLLLQVFLCPLHAAAPSPDLYTAIAAAPAQESSAARPAGPHPLARWSSIMGLSGAAAILIPLFLIGDLAGLLYIAPIAGLLAVILGIKAIRRINWTRGASGRGWAIAGIVMGGLSLIFSGVYFAVVLALS